MRKGVKKRLRPLLSTRKLSIPVCNTDLLVLSEGVGLPRLPEYPENPIYFISAPQGVVSGRLRMGAEAGKISRMAFLAEVSEPLK